MKKPASSIRVTKTKGGTKIRAKGAAARALFAALTKDFDKDTAKQEQTTK